LESYHDHQSSVHTNGILEDAGLFVSKKKQLFINPSLDSIVSCDHCVKGIVKLKCPFRI